MHFRLSLNCTWLNLLLVSWLYCLIPSAFAQNGKTEHTLGLDKDFVSPKANIEDVAWIAGHWIGKAFGGTVEEVWSAPAGGAMMGMFRLIQGEKTGFYEILTISEVESSLIFRLKHFNEDLTGWEEKNETVDFSLVALQENIAFFDGITFQRVDENNLHIYLASENKEGGFDELVFRYERK